MLASASLSWEMSLLLTGAGGGGIGANWNCKNIHKIQHLNTNIHLNLHLNC